MINSAKISSKIFLYLKWNENIYWQTKNIKHHDKKNHVFHFSKLISIICLLFDSCYVDTCAVVGTSSNGQVVLVFLNILISISAYARSKVMTTSFQLVNITEFDRKLAEHICALHHRYDVINIFSKSENKMYRNCNVLFIFLNGLTKNKIRDLSYFSIVRSFLIHSVLMVNSGLSVKF